VAMREVSNLFPKRGSPVARRRSVIAVDRVLDLEATPRLDRQFASAMYGDTPHLTLDMSHLRLIEAAAISSVLRGMAALRGAGADLEVRYPSPMAQQLFEICDVTESLGIEFANTSPQTTVAAEQEVECAS
jgi:anti-anti-sigma regulatory factor